MESSPLERPILLLINGNSRTGQDTFAAAERKLVEAGVPVGQSVLARTKEESVRLLKAEVEAGAASVIVGGGDGTLSLCAGILANTAVAMGVLPLGTGNTFARSLGLPVDLDGAVQTIAGGVITHIDVGQVNGRIFLNSVALGFSSSVAQNLTKEVKSRLGLMAWPYIGAKLLMTHRAIHLEVSAPGHKFNLKTHQFVVANGRYVAGPVVASETASIQDSSLTVFSLGGASRTELKRAVWEWVVHRGQKKVNAKFFETRELRVHSHGRRLKASVDGEIVEQTPLHINVLPRALRVVVSPDFEADKV